MNARIVVGVTGGIAAYKIPHLVRLLRKQGAEVKVVLTSHAQSFVGIDALRTLSGNPVYRDGSAVYDIDHIRLTEWADILLIAPATANTVAKIAHGIADNLLTSIALAFPPGRTIIVPAMNSGMWENPATRENISLLVARTYKVLPVGKGELACGDEGPGRMMEVEAIVEAVMEYFKIGRPLSGKRVLISSGPTEEPIDPVRVITNRSSGKMGAALAREALRMGAEVTVVSGPISAALPAGVRMRPVRTAEEMETALREEFAATDICIMAAAVADYRPLSASPIKLQRDHQAVFSLDLVANRDILAGLGSLKQKQILVGFALENSDDEVRVKEKMMRKQCDLMVANRVETSLGTDTTEITIFDTKGGCSKYGPVSKEVAARELLRHIIEFAGNRHG